MKTRKLYITTIVLVLVGLLFTSCAPATPAPTEVVEPTTAPVEVAEPTAEPVVEVTEAVEPTVAPTEAQPITLEFWYEWDETNNPDAYKWSQDIVAAYQAANPNVTVNAVAIPDQEYNTKFQTAVASGTPPDGFMVRPGSWFKAYVDEGIAVPLDSYLAEGWGDTFVTSAMDVCTYDDSVYCIPGGIRSVQVWYNKTIFADNNLEIPTTWEELQTVADALIAKGITPFALGDKEGWEAPLIYEYLLIRTGGYQSFVDAIARNGKAKFNDPAFVEAATKLSEMSAAGYFPEGVNGLGFSDMTAQFFDGSTAMTVFLNVMPGIASGAAPEGFDMGFFNFPSMGGDTTGLVGSIGGAWAISAKSENQAQMADFLKFWTSKENMTTLSKAAGWVMPVKDTINEADADPMLWSFYTDINNASVIIPFFDYALKADTAAAVFESLQQILDGSIDPQAAMDNWETTAATEYGK
jgi:raffinose/stachyose/melibiose transport system substrate-binding protein